MLFKTFALAALATLSAALPSPVLDLESRAISRLETRDTCTPNGAIIFYPETGYAGADKALAIYSWQPEKAFCQQFQPVVKGGFSFKSYVSAEIVVVLYKNANCQGDAGLVIAKANGNAQNTNVNESGYLSFQAVYVKSN